MSGFPPSNSKRLALVLQYVGTQYCGWQRQLHQRTVQEALENCIAEVVNHPVTVHAAGRTDSGVHAAGQVVHFDTDSPIPAHRWPRVLNPRLPKDIVVRGSVQVPQEWHARFSAIYRRYRYLLYTDRHPNLFLQPYVWHYYQQELDADRMQKCLQPLLGRHHLAAFQRAGSSRPHAWTEVQEAWCRRRDAILEIEVQASGFLYGMMRLLVGLLVQVGGGDRSEEEFTRIWVNQQRHLVKHSAPAQGLCLLRVGYPNPPFQEDVWFDTQPRFLLPGGDESQVLPIPQVSSA
jgi:tRNA pseudouridine38-40 synthase